MRECGRGEDKMASCKKSPDRRPAAKATMNSAYRRGSNSTCVVPVVLFAVSPYSFSACWRSSNAGSRGENLLSQSSPLPLFPAPKLVGWRYTMGTESKRRKFEIEQQEIKIARLRVARPVSLAGTGKSCSNSIGCLPLFGGLGGGMARYQLIRRLLSLSQYFFFLSLAVQLKSFSSRRIAGERPPSTALPKILIHLQPPD